ncbi:MAG: D-TA family PLP-dependent enzyme [Verrucomicrobiota bacterium]
MKAPEIENLEELASPALLVSEERVRTNIRRAVDAARSAEWLRPHIKTHKSPAVLGLQREAGIRKFKCATLSEAEMAARAGAEDLLVALQPVGPAVGRLLRLVKEYRGTKFRTIGDDGGAVRVLGDVFASEGEEIDVLLDIDCGMGRTGVRTLEGGLAVYRLLRDVAGIRPGGLHFYDGHVVDEDVCVRESEYGKAMERVALFREAIKALGDPLGRMVGGGSPTFAMHAGEAGVECSPGTFVFWDAGYGKGYPELPFVPAAWLLTRVVSRPGARRACLDLGHKAVAAERGLEQRVLFPELGEVDVISQSEEHLVLEGKGVVGLEVGTALLGVPWHICPTVALYEKLGVVRGALVESVWEVAGRDQQLFRG